MTSPIASPSASPAIPISTPPMAKIRSTPASSHPIAFRIAMSRDFSMIIMIRVATMMKPATTMMNESSTNIMARSVFSA